LKIYILKVQHCIGGLKQPDAPQKKSPKNICLKFLIKGGKEPGGARPGSASGCYDVICNEIDNFLSPVNGKNRYGHLYLIMTTTTIVYMRINGAQSLRDWCRVPDTTPQSRYKICPEHVLQPVDWCLNTRIKIQGHGLDVIEGSRLV
jgi:hypothetical protein